MDTVKDLKWAEFIRSLRDFQIGKISDTEFKNHRTGWGLHQSLNGSYMLRFRFGVDGLTTGQARQLSQFVNRWVPNGNAHLTTRRNLQVYGLTLESLEQAMEEANSGGLTTYQAGGAVVRSPALCERAGYCEDQVTDPRPLARALDEWITQYSPSLPRKIKVAISGCPTDCAFSEAHDLGLVAVRKGEGEIGYRLLAGGGLGAQPHRAREMEPFVPEKEAVGKLASAILAFQKLGKGRPRVKARLKFLLDEIGLDAFRDSVNEISAGVIPESLPLPRPGDGSALAPGIKTGVSFERWKKTNILPTSIPGRFSVFARVNGGWVTGSQLVHLAEITHLHADGMFNLTSGQDILFPALDEAVLVLVYEKLKAVGLGRAGVGQVGNFTSCPGKEHCKGAQGYSFASEVQGPLEEMSETFPEDVLEGTVRISGCLNQCGRTSLASLGLAGDWKRDADSQKRVVHLFLGGGVYEEGSRIARYAGWVQLERLENFVREFSGRFRELRKEKEDFGHYCLRASEDRSLLPGSGFVQEGKFSDQSGPGFEGEC